MQVFPAGNLITCSDGAIFLVLHIFFILLQVESNLLCEGGSSLGQAPGVGNEDRGAGLRVGAAASLVADFANFGLGGKKGLEQTWHISTS